MASILLYSRKVISYIETPHEEKGKKLPIRNARGIFK
jgi:hypothetical protein